MDRRTTYSRAVNLLKEMHGQTVHLDKLKTLIRMQIASSDKGVVNTIKIMVEMGMIKEIDAFQYKIMEKLE